MVIVSKSQNEISTDVTAKYNIFRLMKEGDWQKISDLVAKSEVDAKATDTSGASALHIATMQSDETAVENLVRLGVDVDVKDSEGLTPLYLAANYSYTNIAIKLLELGADPNNQDVGEDALHVTTSRSNLPLLKVIVDQYDGNINSLDYTGQSLLHRAAACVIIGSGDWDLITWLLKKGIDIQVQDNNGSTVRDVFDNVDWSYTDHYEKLVGFCREGNDQSTE
jgi:ankyrin repeat protein